MIVPFDENVQERDCTVLFELNGEFDICVIDITKTSSINCLLLNEAELEMKNSSDQGGCYPQRPKDEVDNTLRDLQNSSYPTKAEFNNCFIFIENISPFSKKFPHFALCISAHQKIHHNLVPRFSRSQLQ